MAANQQPKIGSAGIRTGSWMIIKAPKLRELNASSWWINVRRMKIHQGLGLGTKAGKMGRWNVQ